MHSKRYVCGDGRMFCRQLTDCKYKWNGYRWNFSICCSEVEHVLCPKSQYEQWHVGEIDPDWDAFIVKTTQYFLPVGERLDREAELAKLREELAYQQGFLATVMKKLSNERFVASAPPAVVAGEQNKRADAEARIAALNERISSLS